MEDLLETGLKPVLKPDVTTAKFLKPENKKKFISWILINLFVFSGFKNFAIVTPGFKAGFKPVSRQFSAASRKKPFLGLYVLHN